MGCCHGNGASIVTSIVNPESKTRYLLQVASFPGPCQACLQYSKVGTVCDGKLSMGLRTVLPCRSLSLKEQRKSWDPNLGLSGRRV